MWPIVVTKAASTRVVWSAHRTAVVASCDARTDPSRVNTSKWGSRESAKIRASVRPRSRMDSAHKSSLCLGTETASFSLSLSHHLECVSSFTSLLFCTPPTNGCSRKTETNCITVGSLLTYEFAEAWHSKGPETFIEITESQFLWNHCLFVTGSWFADINERTRVYTKNTKTNENFEKGTKS